MGRHEINRGRLFFFTRDRLRGWWRIIVAFRILIRSSICIPYRLIDDTWSMTIVFARTINATGFMAVHATGLTAIHTAACATIDTTAIAAFNLAICSTSQIRYQRRKMLLWFFVRLWNGRGCVLPIEYTVTIVRVQLIEIGFLGIRQSRKDIHIGVRHGAHFFFFFYNFSILMRTNASFDCHLFFSAAIIKPRC